MTWIYRRAKDADGFVAKRLLMKLVLFDQLALGSAFYMCVGKGFQYIKPEDVRFIYE